MRQRPPLGRVWQPVTGIGVALVLLAMIFVGGVLGYMVIEGWSFWDAFYMTVITVTTVGYREVHPMSRAGEVFTSLLLLVGVGTALLHIHAGRHDRGRGRPAGAAGAPAAWRA